LQYVSSLRQNQEWAQWLWLWQMAEWEVLTWQLNIGFINLKVGLPIYLTTGFIR